METIIIISDVHLGSPFCLCGDFIRFLDELPRKATLVLNGDTVDHWVREFPPDHSMAVERIRKESECRRLVWVRGNHDAGFRADNPARIEFRDDFSIDRRLYVAHGEAFDNIRPYGSVFIALFRLLHRVRTRLGAEPVHIALYAKRFPLLYNVLRKHVAMNAAEYARENGFEAVAAGHTHYAEDTMIEGVRVLNTGAWTETPPYYLVVTASSIELKEFAG